MFWKVLDLGSFCILGAQLSRSGPVDISGSLEAGLILSTAFAGGACWDPLDLVVGSVCCKLVELGSFCALGAPLSGHCRSGDVSCTEPLLCAIVGGFAGGDAENCLLSSLILFKIVRYELTGGRGAG